MQCNSEAQKFLDLTLDCFLHQHVNETTRGENILFIVYINDLDVKLNCCVLKFADDISAFSEVSSMEKVLNLQSDLNKLHKWSED